MKKVNITIAALSVLFIIAAIMGYPKQRIGAQGEDLMTIYWVVCSVELLVLVALWWVLRYRYKKRQELIEQGRNRGGEQ